MMGKGSGRMEARVHKRAQARTRQEGLGEASKTSFRTSVITMEAPAEDAPAEESPAHSGAFGVSRAGFSGSFARGFLSQDFPAPPEIMSSGVL